MIRICSYCEKEGRDGFLGEKEPLSNKARTDGACRFHELTVSEQIGPLTKAEKKELTTIRFKRMRQGLAV